MKTWTPILKTDLFLLKFLLNMCLHPIFCSGTATLCYVFGVRDPILIPHLAVRSWANDLFSVMLSFLHTFYILDAVSYPLHGYSSNPHKSLLDGYD